MKSIKLLAVLLLLFTLSAVHVEAQVCGDASGDAAVDVNDLVRIVDHIINTTPPGFDSVAADCDGRPGITVGDVVSLCQYLFQGSFLDCTVTGTYGFPASPNDTIFIPRMTGVMDGTDQVKLLVYGSFSSPADGFYVPLLNQGSMANNLFTLTDVTGGSFQLINAGYPSADTTVLLGVDIGGMGSYDGLQNLFLLTYDRAMAGSGDIAPDVVDRDVHLRVAIARGGDLYVPTVVYYDATNLQIAISNMNLSFDAVTGSMAPDSAFVDFTATGAPLGIGFTLTRSDTWIILDDFSGTLPWPTYTTPATVPISADASALGVLDYDGTVDVYYTGFSAFTAPISTINVHLTVHPDSGSLYPPGDVNCDGQVDIEDVLYLVNFLFLNGPAPFACQ